MYHDVINRICRHGIDRHISLHDHHHYHLFCGASLSRVPAQMNFFGLNGIAVMFWILSAGFGYLLGGSRGALIGGLFALSCSFLAELLDKDK
jgi:hypothetical protein